MHREQWGHQGIFDSHLKNGGIYSYPRVKEQFISLKLKKIHEFSNLQLFSDKMRS